MTDRWQELRTLFDQLLELQNVEREARLREIGMRDAALRARLEAMLVVDEDAVDRLRDYEQAAARSILAATSAGASGDPLGVVGLLKGTEPTDLPSDEPIGSGATTREGPAVGRIGQRIGAWRLIEEIGHGGMGVVYLAERADGQFEQRVAVKLLRFGLTMEDLVERFHTERKILATLQHPHIARLLDGGVVDGGTPWFAMEYVEGEPITQYCNAHGLSIDERLHLFGKVCRVVQHAHNHLVIHRDLKPSNILVTKEGEPRLLDFGLAKVLEDRSGEVSSTRPGRRWMTLEYASPEQVRGEPLTTASDTYQLGLILYELLTGGRPYTVKGLSPSDAERVICETVPARPSVFVFTARVETPLTRLVRPDRLGKRLKGDLDTILLKALHKDPARGYASADNMASDIERHRTGRPILARPDTLAYRARKFVQRNRWGVGGARRDRRLPLAADWVGRNALAGGAGDGERTSGGGGAAQGGAGDGLPDGPLRGERPERRPGRHDHRTRAARAGR